MLIRRLALRLAQRITRRPTQVPRKGGGAPVVLAQPTNLTVEEI